MIAVDSSVVVAACASWHESHAAAQEALDEDPRLVGHVALEAYSVLTRLPAPQRIPPRVVVRFLQSAFPDEPLVLSASALGHLVAELEERGIFGGAVYDGLVAMSARAHGLALASLDRRAVQTYVRCGARFRLLEAR